MWSDEINKKLENADESAGPAYNEKAWDNMEALLDKHLPVNNRRRRIILFLLFPSLLTISALFFILPKREKDKHEFIEQTNISDKSLPGITKLSDKSSVIPQSSDRAILTPGKTGADAPTGGSISAIRQQNPHIAPNNEKQVLSQVTYQSKERPLTLILKPGPENKKNKPTSDVAKNNPGSSIELQPGNTIIPENDTAHTYIAELGANQKKTLIEDNRQEDSAESKAEQPINQGKQIKQKAASKLSINLSFGPDISSAGFDNPGKVKMQMGLGISYEILNHLILKTGFFAGYKIYSADSASYHPPYTINRLQKIEANCFVYEIPVNLLYVFPSTKNNNWFISGGLSSYIMKKETYGYFYKNAWGQPQYYKHTYRNKNTHLFAVVNFSGGYQYHFSDRLSIMTEPYLKIPLQGIGVGKVKLNSGGILFTVGYKPFLKK
ncbi:MAG: hypothetical protein ACSLE0_20140 [Chitinophagaceae bacterium]